MQARKGAIIFAAGCLILGLGILIAPPKTRHFPLAEMSQRQNDVIEAGLASYYDAPQKTVTGDQFDANALTAAHKTLPLGSHVMVVNEENGKSATVQVNDRGPYVKDRVIDLSKKAAEILGVTIRGVAPVKILQVSPH